MADIDKLPDSLLLEILSYLNFSNLLAIAATNRRFCRLTQDVRFWKRLDCSTFKTITLNGLYRIVRRPVSTHVVSLRWEGYLRRSPSFQRNSNRVIIRQAVTSPFLAELSRRCPNLRELHIIYADVDSVTLRHFPQNLEFLGFEGSIVGFDFFGPLIDPNFMPTLRGLDLNYCHNLSSSSRFSLPAILSRQQLTTLLLKHCFKISADHLLDIPVRLSSLRSLNVSDSTIVDAVFIRVLAEKAGSLKRLDLSFCHAVNTAVITPLASSDVCRLEKLYLIETAINDEALALFAQHQPQLRYLNVVKTQCTANGIQAVNQLNWRCQIEHKSNDVSEKIGGSFWWIQIRREHDAT